MRLQRLIHQAGPLPLKGGFIPDSSGPVVLAVTGSLYSAYEAYPLQMGIYLDGKQIGTAQLWSNAPSTHRALPTAFIGLPSLTPGQHTIMLAVLPGQTVSDVNDRFSASLIY